VGPDVLFSTQEPSDQSSHTPHKHPTSSSSLELGWHTKCKVLKDSGFRSIHYCQAAT
jgi:hypothetical protein